MVPFLAGEPREAGEYQKRLNSIVSAIKLKSPASEAKEIISETEDHRYSHLELVFKKTGMRSAEERTSVTI